MTKQDILEYFKDINAMYNESTRYDDLSRMLDEFQPQRTEKCSDCKWKWWKDSDGLYRRGSYAESQCPINRREVFEGNGYCYMFEPQERKDKE